MRLAAARVLAVAIVGMSGAACSSSHQQTSPAGPRPRHHAPTGGCVELRYNFRPLIADVRAATGLSGHHVDRRRALRRLSYTIAGLRTAKADATNRLVHTRIATTIAAAERLHGPLTERQLLLRLGVLNQAYSSARTACEVG